MENGIDAIDRRYFGFRSIKSKQWFLLFANPQILCAPPNILYNENHCSVPISQLTQNRIAPIDS